MRRFLHSLVLLSNLNVWPCFSLNYSTTTTTTTTFSFSSSAVLACRQDEKDALLKIKLSLSDPHNFLNTWRVGVDCCKWEGVGCDASNGGHVNKLQLLPHLNSYGGRAYFEASEMSPHLLDLKWLNHLDLTGVILSGEKPLTPIGSLNHLRYLNLSWFLSYQQDYQQLELGNLTRLEVLDLSYSNLMMNDSKSLSNLVALKYLDLGGVNLRESRDLFQVLGKLPSLLHLALPYCQLENHHLSYGQKNLNSTFLANLQYLDLGSNYFDGDLPIVLGNMTSLRYLDLSMNPYPKARDPISFISTAVALPKWFENFKDLVYLNLESTNFKSIEGGLSNLVKEKCHLKFLSLRDSGIHGEMTTGNSTGFCATSLESLDLSGNSFGGRLPDWLDHLSSLKLLNLGHNFLEGPVPADIFGKTNNLIELDLSNNLLEGVIPRSLGFLQKLQYLNLSNNHLQQNLPDNIGQLSNLEVLDFSKNSLEGIIFEAHLANLSRLKELDLSDNRLLTVKINSKWIPPFKLTSINMASCCKFGTQLPQWIQNQTQVVYLDLSYASIVGNIPQGWLDGSTATSVSLRHNQITGLPHNFSSGVYFLDLSWNKITELKSKWACSGSVDMSHNQIAGLIADFFARESYVQVDLSFNKIYGFMPNFSTKVETLLLSHNQITDPKPILSSEVGGVDLSYNLIVGPIQVFSNVGSLDLSNNQITALIQHLPSNVQSLKLSSNQITTVVQEFPSSVDSLDLSYNHITKLTTKFSTSSVDLSYNWIKGLVVSPSLFSSNVFEVDLSHNQITGLMMLNLSSNIQSLDLSYNLITGKLTQFFSPSISELVLSYNQISGPIPIDIDEKMPQLTYLLLNDNHIFGPVPTSLCNLGNLGALDLSHNDLSGSIPDCFGNVSSLSIINLSSNNLSGGIPQFTRNNMLFSLHLNNNSLQGEIPDSLGLHCYIQFLDLGENRLSGSIPSWIGNYFPYLRMLRLRQNNFTGKLPEDVSKLRHLQILDVAMNGLEGGIPNSYDNMLVMRGFDNMFVVSYNEYVKTNWKRERMAAIMKGLMLEYTANLKHLIIMDLSCNYFVGPIPNNLTLLVDLHGLNLSHNLLSGNIPEKIGDMKNLESLDLSNNHLSGTIPSSISALTYLSHLNLSNNNLSGRIPRSTQLDTLYNSNDSLYAGNPLLCGEPLSNTCPGNEVPSSYVDTTPSGQDDDEDGQDDEAADIVMVCMVGFVSGLWGFFGVLLFNKRWRSAYFRFIEDRMDDVYVAVKVKIAKFKRWAMRNP